mgnify:CR=1 FL=1
MGWPSYQTKVLLQAIKSIVLGWVERGYQGQSCHRKDQHKSFPGLTTAAKYGEKDAYGSIEAKYVGQAHQSVVEVSMGKCTEQLR